MIEAVFLFKAAACFLHSRYVLALVLPASLVLLLNLGVTITAVYIAHRYDNSLFCQRHFKLTWAIVHLRAGGRRGTSSRGRVLATLRNTLLLSLLLGLTWLLALPGASLPVQWINTILNCSQGFYILLYSVLANRAIRGQVFSLLLLLICFHVVLLSSSSKSFEHTQVKERITEVASTYMPTYLEKKSNEVVDNDGSANKLTVVKYLPSDDSNSEKSVGSDQSIDIKSEKETKGLDEDLSKRYV